MLTLESRCWDKVSFTQGLCLIAIESKQGVIILPYIRLGAHDILYASTLRLSTCAKEGIIAEFGYTVYLSISINMRDDQVILI